MTPDEMRRAAVLLRCYAVLIDNEEPRTLARLLREEAGDLARLLREEAEAQGWRDIATAPRDGTIILLATARSHVPIYCGSYRFSTMGEPTGHSDKAWRCSSSGRYANPTHWRPLPPPPQGREG